MVELPDSSPLELDRVARAFGSTVSGPGDHPHISVPPTVFASRIRWLRTWELDGGQIEFSQEVEALVRSIQDQAQAFRDLLDLVPDRHYGENLEVPGLAIELKPEQKENILCLLDMPNGANFSVPGAGKTLTTLSLSKLLMDDGLVSRLLVVCPRSAMDAWLDECANSFYESFSAAIFKGETLGPALQLVLVNYEQLENPKKRDDLVRWIQASNTHLVLDEAHRIKGGAKSVRWRACKKLSDFASRVDILTGTPMPNSAADLRALFQVTWPNLTGDFLEERQVSSFKRKTIFVRTTKDELDLPGVEFETITGQPSPVQGNILDALKDQYRGSFSLSHLEGKSLAKRGKAVMALLAAATNPGLLINQGFSDIEFGFRWPPKEISRNTSLSSLIQDYLNYEEPWKYRQVVDIAERASQEGKKLLVWSSFVGNLAALRRYLTKYKPALVYGAVGTGERAEELVRFREDPLCSVLLTNPQTLGEGVSLHRHCHDAVYVDRTFNAGHYLQSVDRIHRLGLAPETETRITFLQTAQSVDERVAQSVEGKVASLAKFLQDPSLTSAAIPEGDEVPAEEALGLTDKDFAAVMSYLEGED